ncbi:MAG: thioredoxin family protein [Clostridia bacterium]|nr:thioredoxin family protein [Clostridia bacterium]
MKLIKKYKVVIIITVMALCILTVFVVKYINRERNFKSLGSDNITEEQTLPLKLYEFVSSTCPACSQMEPIYQSAKEKYSDKMNFEQVNVERNYTLSNKYNVNLIPTFIIVDKEGNVKKKMIGVIEKEEFLNKIESVLNQYDRTIE